MTTSLSSKIKTHALSLGFNLVGFSPVKVNNAAYSHYKKWLEKGMHADLLYMSEKERAEKRRSLKRLLSTAKTVVSLAVNYYHKQSPLAQSHNNNSRDPNGRVATYAYGRDYHKIIGKKLKELEKFIQGLPTRPLTLSYVDTGPILERTFAVQAGLGFIGKNTTLITKEYGSFVLLAEIITDLDLSDSAQNHSAKSAAAESQSAATLLSCGSCTRCIDACPTKALSQTKQNKSFLNARKCIAYHTIENKATFSKIPPKIRQAMKQSQYIFGCDICQLACPHNCRAKPSGPQNKIYKELKNPKIAGDSLPLKKIISIKSNEEFLSVFAGSSLTRAKLKGLKRNAKILLT